jgi:hypothetical protein
MTRVSRQSPRLTFKRAFTEYFVTLHSPGIADPTEAFAACREYLQALLGQLGAEEFMSRLDDETTRMAGQAEQDLRQRFRGQDSQPDYLEVEDRLRECFEYGLARLDTPLTQMPVE